MPKEMMTGYCVTGRQALDYLSKLDEKELDLPFVAVIQLTDSKDEHDYAVYPCVGCSVLPNDLIGFHVAPDARVPRIENVVVETPVMVPLVRNKKNQSDSR